MKFIKLSLITALAVTTAMAGDAKISGDAKLFYGTTDSNNNDLFGKAGSMGDTALELKYSRDLKEGITVNAGLTGVSTIGLENELVGGTWVKHNSSTVPAPGSTQDALYLDTANIVAKVENTTLVVGRQALDTPFFYSETWNIVPNTFDAGVVVNNDIPDTTLIGAWVGRGNGDVNQTVNVANNGAGFTDFTDSHKPAYAFALINKSIPNTTAQAWYYSIPTVAKAYWLQADTSITKEISGGLQYAGAKANGASNSSKAAAVKVAYATGPVSAHIAYSKRSSAGKIDISNIATGHNSASESKLYTEAFWNYGLVGSRKAETIAVGGGYDLDDKTNIGASYTAIDKGSNADVKEFALTATTKIGPLDTTVAFVNTDTQEENSNIVQVYLTAPFSL